MAVTPSSRTTSQVDRSYVDVGSVTKGTLNQNNWDTTATSYTIGPRFAYHNHGRFTPYVEVLFGGRHNVNQHGGRKFHTAQAPVTLPSNATIILPPTSIFTTRIDASKTGFAMLVGGGLDIKIGKRFSVRPIAVDYYLMRMPSLVTGNDTNHNNIRYTAGVSFLFGKK